MQTVLVTVGAQATPAVRAALATAGADVEAVVLPAEPARVDYDVLLDALAGRRLILDAPGREVAGLLRRMMRRDELISTDTAVLRADSMFLRGLGIPGDLTAAVAVALGSTFRPAGVLKDDSGTLVIDSAELRPWTGKRVWVRAYVDDECLCDGEVAWLRVEHLAGGGLRAFVPGRFGRIRSIDGRGLTLACEDAAISSDGAARDQPRRKRIWWDEPEQWRLACPPPPP